MGEDQLVGAFLLFVAVVVFVYYTLWVLVVPFIDADVGLHTFFPPRYYAIAIPAILLVLFVGLVGLFIGLTMLKATVEKQGKIQEDVARSSRQAVASSRGRRKSKKT
ncbi:hypothetical protein NSK_007042 [Nannochloropsis salina CCMP1776]|uniref:Dolichol phosphate-mannose biosynthesis regulatory protein n=1 Tax=Nannochloropsis salina CCMP1776 TaxID=1027361 RepID=A0A4D9CWA2_9STRA|nr:hypothetical protein NSK_007042 [Nannochloropsis salina CCMP1776]|eukprot:TFJ81795.1 hypothetical protein NSK_007042 [Nannochloropsis salina CCMP1776]